MSQIDSFYERTPLVTLVRLSLQFDLSSAGPALIAPSIHSSASPLNTPPKDARPVNSSCFSSWRPYSVSFSSNGRDIGTRKLDLVSAAPPAIPVDLPQRVVILRVHWTRPSRHLSRRFIQTASQVGCGQHQYLGSQLRPSRTARHKSRPTTGYTADPNSSQDGVLGLST